MIYYQKRQWMIDARKKLGLSGIKLARRVGVSDYYVYLIETGSRTPGKDLADKISEILGTDPSMFLTGQIENDETA